MSLRPVDLDKGKKWESKFPLDKRVKGEALGSLGQCGWHKC